MEFDLIIKKIRYNTAKEGPVSESEELAGTLTLAQLHARLSEGKAKPWDRVTEKITSQTALL